MHKNRNLAFHLYMALFLAYLLIPLIIMGGAAFNDSKLPTVYPWKGYTDQWFIDLWNDSRIWIAFRNTILVALAVAAISVPIGTAAAILINSLGGRIRSASW
jgi:spermidine/putrescine transport system permease protein